MTTSLDVVHHNHCDCVSHFLKKMLKHVGDVAGMNGDVDEGLVLRECEGAGEKSKGDAKARDQATSHVHAQRR